METLRKYKEGEGGTAEDSLDGETHVELMGEKRDEEHREKVQRCVETLMSPEPSVNAEKNEKVGQYRVFRKMLLVVWY